MKFTASGSIKIRNFHKKKGAKFQTPASALKQRIKLGFLNCTFKVVDEDSRNVKKKCSRPCISCKPKLGKTIEQPS